MKLLLTWSLASMLSLPVLPFTAVAQDASAKQKITVFFDDFESVVRKVDLAGKADKDTESIVNNYTVQGKPKSNLKTESVDSPIVVSYDYVKSDEQIQKKVSDLIKQKKQVFLYGQELKIANVNNMFGLKNSHKANEQGYNIIGLVDGFAAFISNITAEDINGNNLPITEDMVVQNVLRYEERSKTSPKSIDTSDGQKQDKGKVQTLSYNTDPTVQSSYNNLSTYYSPDALGNNILRASLNTDWILKKHPDSDPNNDEFYIRDNTELYTNTSAATNGYGIHVEHSLPYSGSDNVLDWDPDTKTDAYTVNIALPWEVQWSFPVGNSSLDIYTNGSQTTDKVTWDMMNNIGAFRYNFDGDYNRIQPGTAWASSGQSYAAIDVKNVASFYYASTYKELSQTFNVRYSY